MQGSVVTAKLEVNALLPSVLTAATASLVGGEMGASAGERDGRFR